MNLRFLDQIFSGGKIVCIALLIVLISGCGATGSRKDLMEDFDQANKFYEKGLYSDAERILLKLAKQTPNNYELFFKLGNIYVRTGQFEAAERAYQRCIDIDPEQPKGWYNMSLLRVKQALYLSEQGRVRTSKQEPAFGPNFIKLSDGLMATLGDKER